MFKRPTIAKPMKIAPNEAMNDTQKSSTEKKQNRVLLIVAVVLSALSYHKMDSLSKEQTVVIVPYGAKSADLLITGESASAGYVKLLARLIVADWGSVSKASVDDKSAELLGLVYMDRVEDMRKKLNERAKYFKQFNSISQSMEIANDQKFTITENPEGRVYNTSAKKVYQLELTAVQTKYVGTVVKPPESKNIKIDYTVKDGRFWILDIQE